MSSKSYKLTYFNMRGTGEPIRLLLKLAGQDFEDVRIEYDETWQDKKPDYPWGQLPVLDVDGKRIAQSAAIGRFLAKRFGYAGKDEFQSAKCDELVDALKDLGVEVGKWFRATNEEEKTSQLNKLKDLDVPNYFSKFEKILENNGTGWLVGDSITWADLFVAGNGHNIAKLVGVDIKSNFPNLDKLMENVFSTPKIAEWIEIRPQTHF